MSEKFGWTKREAITLTCPSGAKCVVRRPGPEVGLRGGALMRVLSRIAPEGKDGSSESVVARFELLTDDELAKLMVFAREVVIASLVMPRIVAKPSPGIEGQIGPDDIPFNDFWHVFMWAMGGSREIPVKTKGGETTVDAVESFPEGEGTGAAAGDSSGEISPSPIGHDGDS